ncbi:MAG: hypothetical protein A2Y53_05665 [Chloroflexi bacterium RBG_16_47_49]|nr:MAG: hypothetical protein A2Y53_05665 [Chloroflexi bacterium RBG_16_47_49]
MSDANRESTGYIAEVTYGVNPGGTKQLVNFTNNSLGATNETKNSAFVRSDTNVAGNVRTSTASGGSIGIELQYGGYDSFLEAAMRGTFSAGLNVTATTISAASADNSFNDSGSGLAAAVVGQWFKSSGFATAANNGYFYVVSKTAAKIVALGGTLVNEAATPTVTLKGSVLSNSTTKKSFTIERNFQDITRFLLFTGQRVGDFNLSFATSDIANGSVSFIGQDGASSGTSGFSGSTAAATTASMNTINDIKSILINKVASTLDFTSIDFSINTNSEALKAIANLNATDVRQGSIGVSGNLGVYFEDATFIDKVLAFTALDLAFVTEDAAGNGYIWHFPTTHINGNVENSGIDTTLEEKYSFETTLDSTLGYTMSVSRFAA